MKINPTLHPQIVTFIRKYHYLRSTLTTEALVTKLWGGLGGFVSYRKYKERSRCGNALSHPCGNFSDTSSWIFLRPKGSIGHVFTVCIRTENQNQASFSPFGPHEISVLIELTLGHLRYHLTDVPPQPNSPPGYVIRLRHRACRFRARNNSSRCVRS